MNTDGYKSKGATMDILERWLDAGDNRYLNKFTVTCTETEITFKAIKG